eukprot:313268-Alexandrium_andersonii.AAC.1
MRKNRPHELGVRVVEGLLRAQGEAKAGRGRSHAHLREQALGGEERTPTALTLLKEPGEPGPGLTNTNGGPHA